MMKNPDKTPKKSDFNPYKEYFRLQVNKFEGESVYERQPEIYHKLFTHIEIFLVTMYDLINGFYSEEVINYNRKS